jgi:ParB/RepB/Spo0J family partition protein
MNDKIFTDLTDYIDNFANGPKRREPSDEVTTPKIAHRLTFVQFKEIIDISPLQTRETIFDPNISFEDKELLESVSKVGIITPIIVRDLRDEEGSRDIFSHRSLGERKFGLVAGHRRVAAGQAAGLLGTEAVVLKPGDNHELITLAENMGRKELTPYEKALALKNLSERQSLSIRGVATATGYSRSHVQRLLAALESPKLLKDLWMRGDLSATTIASLKKYWSEFSEERAGHLREKIQTLTQSAAKELADQLNAGTPLEPALNTLCSVGSPILINTTSNHKQPGSKSRNKPSSIKNNKANSFLDDQKAFVSAIRDVYYRFSEKKANDLYYLAVANGVKDPDVIWATVHYVVMGGDIELAFQITQRIMTNRMYRGVMKREIRNHKKISGILKSKKPNQTTVEFFTTVFPNADH